MNITASDLPESLPLFPLPGALLLPHGRLPLNIFEPRYLHMVLDALSSPHRLIGMIQPLDGESMENETPLYKTGCAGKIESFTETHDGRILITLCGVCRFDCADTAMHANGYRTAKADWSRFSANDFSTGEGAQICRDTLLKHLKVYLKHFQMPADWEMIETSHPAALVTTLAMVCPFDYKEQQALIEEPDLEKQAEMLCCLLQMAVHDCPQKKPC